MKRVLIFFALIIFVLLIQTAVLSNWYALPVVPDILLLVVLYIGFHNGSLTGEVSGFFSGLVLDFLSAAPLGLNALVRTLIGFLSGLFYNNFETSGIIIPAVLGFTATAAKAILIRFVSFFYPGSILTYSLFSSVLWYECVFSALCAPVVFWFLSFFKILAKDFPTEKIQ
ncbi:rod shape-determining protein MreD [Treponema sp. OMZ 840]|uniref:rod shape-determining protein MreD n=1 Tax=Treponema sp. OMZ 840 TaxID=244313 RepID=UPI003D8ADFB7